MACGERMLLRVLFMAAAVFLAGCRPVNGGSGTEPDEAAKTGVTEDAPAETDSPYDEPEEGHMQLIPDTAFLGGMELITQKDHGNGDAFSAFAIHDFRGGSGGDEPFWRLCQWDSGPDLSGMMADASPEEITDGQWRSFRYDPETDEMRFYLDTSLYYGGSPAREGDYWPHLLIEAPDFGCRELPGETAEYYRCDAEKMTVSFDIRLTDYEASPVEGDWVDAAQFLMYFYVKGTETEDFCWFGLQLFDSRWPRNEHYVGYDGGKADASGAMIYSVGSKYVYKNAGGTALWKDGAPSPDGEWRHVEIDLVPYLKDMLKRGSRDGYFKAGDLSGLRIDGMNVGWETIGTFRHGMELRHLRLTALRGEG